MMTRNPANSRKANRLLLLTCDIFFLVAYVTGLYSWRVGNVGMSLWRYPSPWVFVFALLVSVYIFGGYEPETLRRGRDAFLRLAIPITLFATVGTLIVYLGVDERAGLLGRGVLTGSLLGFLLSAGSVRWLLFLVLNRRYRRAIWVFVVSSSWMKRLKQDLATVRFPGSISFLDEAALDRLPQFSESEKASFVVGLDRHLYEGNHHLLRYLLESRVKGHTVLDLTTFYERYWLKIPVEVLAPEWLVQSDGFSLFQRPARFKVKRLFDLLMGALLLVPALPLMLLAVLAIRAESSGAALFRQVRTGKDGRLFTIFKFRSMYQDAEKAGAQWAAVRDPRITRVGGFLRKTRIDELPQLFNVLKGEMSFIGPRPERPEFNRMLAEEIPFYELRHLVNPGITGWAQIMYPYGASVEDALEKLQYDLYYIKNHSFLLDVRIALKTARIVVSGRGR